MLADAFATAGHGDIRPSYGSVLVPLYEEDGLRMGELARRSRLSKQTMTQMVRQLEGEGLVERRPDPDDARASQIFLTRRARNFGPVAADAIAQLERAARRRLGARRLGELKGSLRELLELGRTS
jgi:DNA-binding MarR family transcriptional regulator